MAPLRASERSGDRRCATEATATAAATATNIIAAALDSVVKSAVHVPLPVNGATKGSNAQIARCTSRKTPPYAVCASPDGRLGRRCSGDGASALSVLTNQVLLEQIADFMCGVPNLLVEFKRRAMASHRDEEIDPWSRTIYCNRDDEGLLTRLAMERDDRKVMRMLLRIHEMPFYRCMTALRFDTVLAVGVELGQLKTLRWLTPKLKNAAAHSTTTTIFQAHGILDIAIAKGNLAMMQWLQDTFPDACNASVSPFVIVSAPKEVRFQVAHWLHAHEYSDRCLLSARVINFVAEQGDLVTLRFLHNALGSETSIDVFTSATMDIAASCGHMELVRFLHQRRDEGCTTRAMDLAAQHGDLEIVRFLHQHRREGCSTAAMDDAAAYGHMDVVKFLHTYRNEGCTQKAMDMAARNGHIDIVQFLHDRRREGCTQDAMDQAASRGHLQIVQFLHVHRSEGCTTAAMDGAASAGHLDIVRFLHENRDEGCTTDAMDRAAQNGHLDVVRFLHENRAEGCTRAAMNSAASHDHLEIVEFLHTHRSEGCSKRALSSAARHGFAKVVQFLVENRMEGCAEEALRAAYRNGRFEVARYLHDRGFMGNVSKCVISCCCPTILQYS